MVECVFLCFLFVMVSYARPTAPSVFFLFIQTVKCHSFFEDNDNVNDTRTMAWHSLRKRRLQASQRKKKLQEQFTVSTNKLACESTRHGN